MQPAMTHDGVALPLAAPHAEFGVNGAALACLEWLAQCSARTGFLPYQLDLAWHFIAMMARVGVVSACRDSKADFLREHYLPYLTRQQAGRAAATVAPCLAHADDALGGDAASREPAE